MADRYTYVPLIGIFLALAWSIPDKWLTQPASRRVTLGACGAALAALTAAACLQTATWRDTYTMAENAIRKNPNNDIAYSQRGYALLVDGRIEEAEADFQKAIALNPTKRLDCYCNLGMILVRRQQPAEAVELFRKAIEYDPDYLFARRGLITALIQLDQLGVAEREITAALERFPRSASIWYLKGNWHLLRGEINGARNAMERALEFDPAHEKAAELLDAIESGAYAN
jgi:tetratricopeptide (TPR) repeat protein